MFKLDNDFLVTLGLGGLPVDEKNKLLQHIYETLEMRVGMRLAEKMTDEQLTEFEGFIDRSDEAGALKWLETNFPNYKDVVAEELEKLKNEVGQSVPQILAAAQAAAAQPQPQMAPVQPSQPQQFTPQQPPAAAYANPPVSPFDAPAQQSPAPFPQPEQPQYPQQQPPAGPQPPAGFTPSV